MLWIRSRWISLTTGGRLAVVAVALGALALAARPYRSSRVTIDLDELAAIIDGEGDHVTAGELAAWIVEGRADYRLIDLRSEAEFAAYHIPTAENVRLIALPRAGLRVDQKVVLYSEGGVHASQAWMLMRARGLRSIYTLKGGIEQWEQEVLFPVAPASPTAGQRARFERAAAMSRFFGGHPRDAAAISAAPRPVHDHPHAEPAASAAASRPAPGLPAASAPPPSLPAASAPPPAGAVPTAPRPKKEGC